MTCSPSSLPAYAISLHPRSAPGTHRGWHNIAPLCVVATGYRRLPGVFGRTSRSPTGVQRGKEVAFIHEEIPNVPTPCSIADVRGTRSAPFGRFRNGTNNYAEAHAQEGGSVLQELRSNTKGAIVAL